VSKVSNASATDEETQGDRWFAGEEDDGEDLITIGLFLKPGDVVELSLVPLGLPIKLLDMRADTSQTIRAGAYTRCFRAAT
jgi:hypothetical protein